MGAAALPCDAAPIARPHARVRCRRTAQGHYETPSEPTIRRLLQRVDIEQLESQLGDWLQAQGAPDEPVALDGKSLRGSQDQGRARQLVAAFAHTRVRSGTQATSS